jgi:hypothetical protein
MDQELKYRRRAGWAMNDRSSTATASGEPRSRGVRWRRLASVETRWSFVYIFFTNHIPFDAPNRSEPCPTDPIRTLTN